MKYSDNRKYREVELPVVRETVRISRDRRKEKEYRRYKKANKELSKLFFRGCILSVLLIATFLLKMKTHYDLITTINEGKKLDKEITVTQRELEVLEGKYISSYDLKFVEEKSKELGFVPNKEIKYVIISD